MRGLNLIRGAALVAAIALPPAAAAHGVEAARHWWSFDPWVWAALLGFVLLYARGLQLLRAHAKRVGRNPRVIRPRAVCAFVGALAALFLALIWPLDVLASTSFAAHMSQHMVLIALAAPLLVYAEPSIPIMHALPALRRIARSSALRCMLRTATTPRIAFALHGAVIWGWHAPRVFELGVRNDFFHVLGHLAFLGSALLFWSALRRIGRAGGDGYGVAALWTLGTMMHMGFLAALITFAPRLLYQVYAEAPAGAMTPLEDQQLAGLIMWVPASIPYLVAGMGFVMTWLIDAERHAPCVGGKR